MSKMKRKVTNHDMRRALESVINHAQLISLRQDDLDRIIHEYIEFKKDVEKFTKFLDGKYKQRDDIGSGADATSSSE